MAEQRIASMLGKTVPELRRDFGGTRAFARALAYYEDNSPTDELWQMTATICAAIYRSHGIRVQPSAFLPKAKAKQPAALGTPEALRARFAQVFGQHDRAAVKRKES